jgi:hypothetical protein
MPILDVLKASLSVLDPATPVRVQMGIDGTVIQIPAGELMAALGVTPGAAGFAVPPSAAATTPPAATDQRRLRPASNLSFLRIRSQPGINAPVVGQYDRGTVFTILAANPVMMDNYTWYRTADGQGWIAIDFAEPADDVVQAPQASASPVAPVAPAEPPSWALSFTANQRGVGTSAGGWAPDARQLDIARRNRIEFVLICTYEPNQAARTIQPLREAGVRSFIFRACTHERPSTPRRFIDLTVPILQEYAAVHGSDQPLLIAIGNEPNIANEGWGIAWRDGEEFANWWLAVAAAYRQFFPGVKLGFPAMSPGGDVPGIRMNEAAFVAGATGAIQAADWIGVHYYWADPGGQDINPPLAQWRAQFGNKPIVGTEVGPADAVQVSPGAVQIAYQKFAEIGIPACAWLLSGAGAWQNAAWDVNNILL